MTWLAVLAAGTLFAALESKPLTAILFAQFANGLLLPVIALALLWLVNREVLLGKYRNSLFMNLLAGMVIIICIFLGLSKLV